MKGLEDLTQIKDVSLQDILVNLLDGEHDLDLKTRISNPKDLAALKVFSNALKGYKKKRSSKRINYFVKKYLRYMVSYKGMSREETIRAIIGLYEQETIKMTIGDRLTTNLK